MLKARTLASRAIAVGSRPAKRTAANASLAAPADKHTKLNKKISDDQAIGAIPAEANRVLRTAETNLAFSTALDSIVGGRPMRESLSNTTGATDVNGHVIPGVGREARGALAQLMTSNGYVDAAGTADPTLAEPPPLCMRAQRAVQSQIRSDIMAGINDLTAGGGFLGSDAANRLAKMVMTGDISWDEVTKISKTLHPNATDRGGESYGDIVIAWELLEPLLRSCYETQFGVPDAGGAITSFHKRVGSTARHTKIPAASLITYIKRVLETWKNAVASFRRGETIHLNLMHAVEHSAHIEYYNSEALTARVTAAAAQQFQHRAGKGAKGAGGCVTHDRTAPLAA